MMPLFDPMLQDVLDGWKKSRNERRSLISNAPKKRPAWIEKVKNGDCKEDGHDKIQENAEERSSFSLQDTPMDDIVRELARRGSSERRVKSSVSVDDANRKMMFGVKERGNESKSKNASESITYERNDDSEFNCDLYEQQTFCTSELCAK